MFARFPLMLSSCLPFRRLALVCLGFVSLCASPAVFALEAVRFADAAQPRLAADASGRVFLAYADGVDVFVVRSDDDGGTFSAPVKVASVPGLKLGMRRGPRIAVRGEAVTVTVQTNELIAFTSLDAGRSWTGPVTVNDVAGSAREGLHDLAVAPDGRLFATWLDLRSGKTALYGAESTDAGRSWTPNSAVYRSPEISICECCHPTAVFDEAGNLAVMWRNWLGGSRDLWLVTRAAGSAKFSEPVKQGQGTWKLNGCPMDGGDIIVRGRGVFDTVWQRAGDVILQAGTAPELRLSGGKQPVATALGDATLIVWQKGTTLWSAERAANGTVSAPQQLATGARFPVLVSLPGHAGALLAYEQGAEVVVERFRP